VAAKVAEGINQSNECGEIRNEGKTHRGKMRGVLK